MNLTCSYCQTPFTLGMAEKVAALQRMQAENMHHYDAHCPRCGRANAVSRERLEMFTPGWQDAIKETASESAPVSSTQTVAPKPTSSEMSAAPASVVSAPAKAPANPAVKKPAAKKPAAKKPAKTVVKAKAKPEKAVKKTAAKKSKRKK
ncbi:MAG: hypothetical protein WCA79_09715 [Anaerolineales bacterium]